MRWVRALGADAACFGHYVVTDDLSGYWRKLDADLADGSTACVDFNRAWENWDRTIQGITARLAESRRGGPTNNEKRQNEKNYDGICTGLGRRSMCG